MLEKGYEMNAMKVSAGERLEAQDQLREMFPPGTTVKTVLRHVSQSGMSRSISVISSDCEDVTWLVLRALEGARFDDRWGGIKRGGCGMDMGFDLVYELGAVLYRGGFDCIGKGCPSNDHSNGDRDYGPHYHESGGYALPHRWL